MDDKTKKKIIGAAAGLADPILRKWRNSSPLPFQKQAFFARSDLKPLWE